MKRTILVHEEAQYDIIDCAYYIAKESLLASNSFINAIGTVFELLAEMP